MDKYEYVVHIPYTNFEATVRIRSNNELIKETIFVRALDVLKYNGFENAWKLKPSLDTVEIVEL